MPTQSPSSKAIDLIIREAVAPRLREQEFKRQGRSFARPNHDVYHCIHFQASRWNTPARASFTINLLVSWPRWHEVWTGQPFPSNPASAAPVAQDRVGSVLYGKDQWWELGPETNDEAIVQEVWQALHAACLQYFRSYDSTAELLAQMDAGRALPGFAPTGLVHATLLVAANRVPEARRVLDGVHASKPDWQAAQAVANRLGLGGAA